MFESRTSAEEFLKIQITMLKDMQARAENPTETPLLNAYLKLSERLLELVQTTPEDKRFSISKMTELKDPLNEIDASNSR